MDDIKLDLTKLANSYDFTITYAMHNVVTIWFPDMIRAASFVAMAECASTTTIAYAEVNKALQTFDKPVPITIDYYTRYFLPLTKENWQ